METRLQTLRRLRSERLRPFAEREMALLQTAGWACSGCGCYIDDYSLDCSQCWDRARNHAKRGNRPEMKVSAENYLARRRLHGAEKQRRISTEQATANPWNGGPVPIGAAGHWGAF